MHIHEHFMGPAEIKKTMPRQHNSGETVRWVNLNAAGTERLMLKNRNYEQFALKLHEGQWFVWRGQDTSPDAERYYNTYSVPNRDWGHVFLPVEMEIGAPYISECYAEFRSKETGQRMGAQYDGVWRWRHTVTAHYNQWASPSGITVANVIAFKTEAFIDGRWTTDELYHYAADAERGIYGLVGWEKINTVQNYHVSRIDSDFQMFEPIQVQRQMIGGAATWLDEELDTVRIPPNAPPVADEPEKEKTVRIEIKNIWNAPIQFHVEPDTTSETRGAIQPNETLVIDHLGTTSKNGYSWIGWRHNGDTVYAAMEATFLHTRPMEDKPNQAGPETEAPNYQRYAICSVPYARLRSGPGTNYDPVGYLTSGQHVEILNKQTGEDSKPEYAWHQVKTSGGLIAWCREDLIVILNGADHLDSTPSDYLSSPIRSNKWWVRGDDNDHNGWDIASSVGTPIYASLKGKVLEIFYCKKCGANGKSSIVDYGYKLNSRMVINNPDWGWGYGHHIKVLYKRDDLPQSVIDNLTKIGLAKEDLVVTYAHLNKMYVSNNEEVDSDKIIGELGNSGNSTGPHLHLEVKGYLSYKRSYTENVDPAIVFER